MLSSRTRRSGGRAAALLRLAAVTVGRTESARAFYRRLSARIGKAKAVTATARKIAVLYYNAVRRSRRVVLRDALSHAGNRQFASARQSLRICSPAYGADTRSRFLGIIFQR